MRSLAYNALGCAYLLMDDYTQAVEAYQQAILHGRAAANPVLEMLGISILAQAAVQHGQLRLAFRVASEGIARYERRGEHSGSLPPSFTRDVRSPWTGLLSVEPTRTGTLRRSITPSSFAPWASTAISRRITG